MQRVKLYNYHTYIIYRYMYLCYSVFIPLGQFLDHDNPSFPAHAAFTSIVVQISGACMYIDMVWLTDTSWHSI